MASAEIPNPDAADSNPNPSLSPSPLLPPRKRRPSPSPSPARSPSRSCSPSGRRSHSLSRSPCYPDGKRRRHNDLTVEVFRDFLRDRCTHPDIEGKYAHPHHSVSVERDNKVTVCADSLRKNCFWGRVYRYYHPPPHTQENELTPACCLFHSICLVCFACFGCGSWVLWLDVQMQSVASLLVVVIRGKLESQ